MDCYDYRNYNCYKNKLRGNNTDSKSYKMEILKYKNFFQLTIKLPKQRIEPISHPYL